MTIYISNFTHVFFLVFFLPLCKLYFSVLSGTDDVAYLSLVAVSMAAVGFLLLVWQLKRIAQKALSEVDGFVIDGVE